MQTFDVTSATAKERLDQFAREDDQLMKDHQEALNCFNCEALLQKGIDAIQWLTLAEKRLRSLHMSGRLIPLDFSEWLKDCYQAFLSRCEYAKNWIKECHDAGYEVSNAKEFIECVESAEDWLEQFEWRSRESSILNEG